MYSDIVIPTVPDDTKLIRFLDKNGAEKSIGSEMHKEIHCSFHYGRLSHYQNVETCAGDAKERSTAINLGNGVVGSDCAVNDALVSCWSTWDGNDDPWVSFKDSSLAHDKDNICVITSTVGKVRRIFNQTIEISKKLFDSSFPSIVLFSQDGAITYYPGDSGVDCEHWEKITDPRQHGLAMSTACTIFHKRHSNGSGQNYAAEKEYRFAALLGIKRFFGDDTKIALSAEDVIWRDFPLILIDGVHYIEKAYLLSPDPDIETACYLTNVTLERKF